MSNEKKDKIKIGDLVEIESTETIHLSYNGMWEDAENQRYMRLGIVIDKEMVLDQYYNKQPLYKDGVFIVMTNNGENQKYYPFELRKVD
tara:strand:- start:2825 stop:3091 length:267 start_codon:yes stop_codon:yes gene_type:complete